MAKYIDRENTRAYQAFVNAGYTLEPAFKHYCINGESYIAPVRFEGDYFIPYDDSSLVVAISPIYVVRGWEGSSRAFHKFLKVNNLLLSQQ